MVSFCKLWENMDRLSIMENEISDNVISVIKTGMNVDEEFWDKFLQVINNKSGLSELLDVSPEKINKWHNKIKNAVKQVEKETGDVLQNKKLI